MNKLLTNNLIAMLGFITHALGRSYDAYQEVEGDKTEERRFVWFGEVFDEEAPLKPAVWISVNTEEAADSGQASVTRMRSRPCGLETARMTIGRRPRH